jgi:hypothetical protein
MHLQRRPNGFSAGCRDDRACPSGVLDFVQGLLQRYSDVEDEVMRRLRRMQINPAAWGTSHQLSPSPLSWFPQRATKSSGSRSCIPVSLTVARSRRSPAAALATTVALMARSFDVCWSLRFPVNQAKLGVVVAGLPVLPTTTHRPRARSRPWELALARKRLRARSTQQRGMKWPS